MPLVDVFDEPAATQTADGKLAPQTQLVDIYDEPPKDFSNIGEFDAKGATEGQKWWLALGYLTTPSEKARADIIRKRLPGALIETDPNNGKLVVSYKGEVGYIDAPGVTLSGVLDSIAQVGKYLPSGKLAGIGGNLATRIGLAGAGAAATSVVEDVAAISQGSEQGVNIEKAAVTGAAGAIGQGVSEVVVAPAAGWLAAKGRDAYRALRGTPGVLNPDGTLSQRGRELAQSIGLDPDAVTPQLAKQLQSSADDAIAAGREAGPDTGEAATRLALSRRFNTPLTKGEINQDYAQQSLEENLKRMDVSTKAGQTMRQAEEQAAARLRGNDGQSGFGMLNREISGARAADVSDAGQIVLGQTKAAGSAAKAAYTGQYTTAKQLGAALDSAALKAFPSQAEAAVNRAVAYDPALYPKTAAMLKYIEQNAAKVNDADGITLAQLENVSKLINSEWRGATPTDRGGLNVLREQFSQMVDSALASGKISGNQNSVAAWKAGRDLYSRFQTLFGVDRDAGNAERAAGNQIKNWLKSDNVTGEEVITKAVQNKALTERILQIHGTDSPAHTALKQGTLELVFRPALKNEGISPRLIVSQYERYFKGKNAEQMAAIFSPADRKAIREFVGLATTKIPREGVVNYSNSGNVVVKATQQLLQKLGLISAASGNVETAVALGAANALSRGVSASQAKTAVRGLVPNLSTAVPTSTAAGIASEQEQ